jgi:hypothetical protein
MLRYLSYIYLSDQNQCLDSSAPDYDVSMPRGHALKNKEAP